jgi:hypothetical protein
MLTSGRLLRLRLGKNTGYKFRIFLCPLSVAHHLHGIGVNCRHHLGHNPIWFLWWPTGIHDVRGTLVLCISASLSPGMDSSWCSVDVVRNVCRHRRRPCCPIMLQPTLGQVLVNGHPVVPSHLVLVSWTLGGRPPSGGRFGRCGRRAPGGSTPALLCQRDAGWLGAWSPTALGASAGPITKSTVRFRRLVPAGACHGNPRPVGSAARQMQASVHMTRPSPSRRMRAGMVVTPNFANRAFTRGPAAFACVIAVHLGIV